MIPSGTLLLTREDVSALLSFPEYISAVEEAFRSYGHGKTLQPALMHIDSVDGEFHIKAGGLELEKRYFGLKANGGFFSNAERFALPNIQGLVLLCDGQNGFPLALMDSRVITAQRTAAATAIACKYLANPDTNVATICGCGTQGRMQLRALLSVLPIEMAYVFSRNLSKAKIFATDVSKELSIKVEAVETVGEGLNKSGVCVTCTPAKRYIVRKEDVRPCTLIAAVGADSPDKQELDPELIKSNKLVVDILEQCAQVGELHHALDAGMKKEDVYADLGEIVTGKKPGRESRDEIIIFDSTGTALQDVAAAAAVYKKAIAAGIGQAFDFFR